MIDSETGAKRVAAAAQQASSLLDRALLDAKPELTEEEFLALRRAIGKAMGEIYCEILRPIWKRHPALEPPD